MKLVKNIESLSKIIDTLKSKGKSIGFVPTMGALHEGHLSLIKMASYQCDVVVVSIFVNPTQFNNSNDLSAYPHDLENDIRLLESVDCSILFAPSRKEVYPSGENTRRYKLNDLDKRLEGKKRPGHFDGVCTIVHKLFNWISPHKAYFGEKDFQQLLIIKQLVKTLSLPIDIISGPTIREEDGLAKSSRNSRLNPSDRELSAIIYNCLSKAKSMYKDNSPLEIISYTREALSKENRIIIDYIEIVNSNTLESITSYQPKIRVQMMIAVFIGNVRLIDNLALND
ncbi:MAG: pantoate--beta-alanine ligase [Flavobacteriales bacterium]